MSESPSVAPPFTLLPEPPPVAMPWSPSPAAVRFRLPALGGALLLALFSLVATAMPSNAAGTPAGQAWVRAAHLVPGLGAASIDLAPTAGGTASTVSGAASVVRMSPSATYGDVTKYRQQAPGDYQVQVRLAGASGTSTPMLSRTVTLVANKAYTMAILGTAKAPRLEMLSDDLTPPAAGSARVRLLPAASAAPTVTVVAKNGPTIAENAVLGQASSYASVPAGTWTLDTSSGSAAPTTSSIRVASGSVYTLLVLDSTAGSAAPRLDLITDAAGTASAPKGGAQTGGGGTATQFVGTAPSHGLPGSLRFAVLAFALVIGSGLLVRSRRTVRS